MRYGRGYPARVIIKRGLVYVAAPTNFAATVSDGYVTLTWTDVSTLNTSYMLERKLGSGSYSTISDAISGSATSYADPEELQLDKTYTYRLRAKYLPTLGESTTVEVSISIPPYAHENLQAFPQSDVTGNISVRLTWDKYSLYEQGTLVERSLNGSSWSTVATTDPGATQYEDTGLTVNTTYYYRVSAVGLLANSSNTSATVYTRETTVAGLLLPFLHKTRTFPRE